MRDDAIAFARRIVAEGRPVMRVRDRQDMVEPARSNPQLFADFRRSHARAFGGFKAPENIIKAVEAAVALPFEKILEEGVALRASDIDVAAMLGYNWPVYTGGPMFWAGMVGLPAIVAALKDWQARWGDRYAPAPLLERLAGEGATFASG